MQLPEIKLEKDPIDEFVEQYSKLTPAEREKALDYLEEIYEEMRNRK